MTNHLGKIEPVDLRDGWPDEARDFTPWLAENLAELSDIIGVQLESPVIESPVGTRSLDILAVDSEDDRPVIIENQLEATDNDHLSRLLIYAAGKQAKLVIWVSAEMKDEHRQVLDWLNQRTDEEVQFFGVVVELWTIGDSKPAPYFKLVAAPNDWQKANSSSRSGESLGVMSERRERYMSFFQELIDTLRDDHKFTNHRKARPNSWHGFPSGYARIRYGGNFTRDKQARVDLYFDDGDRDRNLSLLESLEEHKSQIETDLGQSLDWQRLENRKACRIQVVRPGTIDDYDDALAEIRGWMVDRLLKFKEVFGPYLEELTKQ